jgi:hypothetical protein
MNFKITYYEKNLFDDKCSPVLRSALLSFHVLMIMILQILVILQALQEEAHPIMQWEQPGSIHSRYRCYGLWFRNRRFKIVCLTEQLKATLTSSQLAALQLDYTYANIKTWSNLPAAMSARKGIPLGILMQHR